MTDPTRTDLLQPRPPMLRSARGYSQPRTALVVVRVF
jgi:hypothetical protein